TLPTIEDMMLTTLGAERIGVGRDVLRDVIVKGMGAHASLKLVPLGFGILIDAGKGNGMFHRSHPTSSLT
ncbi:MAG: hypothetical protein WA746_07535, partial [Isosphaeraceae bacterium]